jgi:hypothetical protein
MPDHAEVSEVDAVEAADRERYGADWTRRESKVD